MVGVDDACGDGESEAGSFAGGLGGEEGFEDVRQGVGRDACAAVGDVDAEERWGRSGGKHVGMTGWKPRPPWV